MFYTDGYWISPAGDLIKVHEHIVTVAADPERFGVDPKDKRLVAFKSGVTGAREDLLTEVMRRGWVRVRGARSGRSTIAVFEAWRFERDQKDNVLFVLRKLELHDEDNVELHELATKKGIRSTPGELRADGIPLNGPSRGGHGRAFRLHIPSRAGLGAWLRHH